MAALRDPNGIADYESERSLSEGEAPTMDRAVQRAQEMIHSARLALASDDPAAIDAAMRQFGDSSEATRAYADAVYGRLEARLAHYSAENFSVNVRNTADYAYVDPGDSSRITVRRAFFKADVDLQAALLIHEGTHFYDVGGTLELGSSRMVQFVRPDLRIYNAYSYFNYASRAAIKNSSGGCLSSHCY